MHHQTDLVERVITLFDKKASKKRSKTDETSWHTAAKLPLPGFLHSVAERRSTMKAKKVSAVGADQQALKGVGSASSARIHLTTAAAEIAAAGSGPNSSAQNVSR